jgi:3-oxoadipate enol-lactonase
MPDAFVNGITINYLVDNEVGTAGTIVLINGLADDLYSWDFQIPALVDAGYRVLRFDNRGIGATDTPEGPYTSKLLADDASLTLACTYGAADPFCQQMFAMWGDLAQGLGVPFVMRDVALWAFTGSFFEERPEEAVEFGDAMASLEMSLDAYLSQLNVIQQHDALPRASQISAPTLVLAGEEDILIPVRLSARLRDAIPGAQWATVPGGHACLWESPDAFNTAFINFLSTIPR